MKLLLLFVNILLFSQNALGFTPKVLQNLPMLGKPLEGFDPSCVNGTIYAMAYAPPDRFVIGGDFNKVGYCIGMGAPFDPAIGDFTKVGSVKQYGVATSWNPNVKGNIQNLYVSDKTTGNINW